MTFRPKYKGAQHRNQNKIAGSMATPPNSQERSILGQVLRCYDAELMATDAVPDIVKQRLERSPGLVLAACKTLDGQVFLVPFKDTPDHLYSVYGNARNIEGMLCRINYTGKDPSTGRLTPYHYSQNGLIDTGEASNIADLGAIL